MSGPPHDSPGVAPDRLARLADAVADAQDIDWIHEESSAAGQEEGAVIRELSVISRIGRLLQSPEVGLSPAGAGSSGAVSSTRPVAETGAAPNSSTSWGPLTIRATLGQGTFGTVYRAWDAELQREVALKILRDVRPGAPGPLVEEARVLARIRHSNIVTVFGVARFDDRVGFWMDFVQGRTLEEIQKTQGTRSAEEAALCGLDLCRALAAVHQAGLLHCDVKAQNVMRAVGGRTVLMDFGAAVLRRAGEHAARRAVGTPKYTAPEVIEGEAPTVRSDIYSLGVLLYYLVSGTYPVRGGSIDEIKESHRHGRRQWLRDVRSDLPAAFVRAVDAATAVRPEDRPESAGALEALLQRAADWSGWHRPAPLERSIAVLPFDDMSPDRHLDYLCDGIAEEIINALVRVPDIRVIGRGSSFKFHSRRYDRTEVSSSLRVQTILEGSVRTAGSGLRVTARLIDAGDGVCLWGERFDRQVEEVFDVQDDIARAVADVLGARVVRDLAHPAPAAVAHTPDASATGGAGTLIPYRRAEVPGSGIAGTRNLEAYTLYLRGRFAWDQRTEAALEHSIGYFEAAIEQDPQYAEAHAGLADAYATLGFYGGLAPDAAMPRATAAARRAIDLSGLLPGPHATLGCVAAAWERRWDDAEARFQRAIELAPMHPTVWHWYAINYLVPLRRFDEASEALRRAAEADPLSTPIRASAGILRYFAHRFDEAERQLRETLDLDGTSATARLFLGLTLAEIGRPVDAQRELEVARATAQSPEMTAAAGYAAARAGDDAAARRAVAELEMLSRVRYVSPSLVAQVYAGLGDVEAALEWLEEALAVRALDLAWLSVRPTFDGLRADARLRAMVADIGL
jgi:eukaryotic-like serine/threonine-protein kinase